MRPSGLTLMVDMSVFSIVVSGNSGQPCKDKDKGLSRNSSSQTKTILENKILGKATGLDLQIKMSTAGLGGMSVGVRSYLGCLVSVDLFLF